MQRQGLLAWMQTVAWIAAMPWAGLHRCCTPPAAATARTAAPVALACRSLCSLLACCAGSPQAAMATAVQRLRAIHLYRHSLKNMLSWAVRREVFYVEVRGAGRYSIKRAALQTQGGSAADLLQLRCGCGCQPRAAHSHSASATRLRWLPCVRPRRLPAAMRLLVLAQPAAGPVLAANVPLLPCPCQAERIRAEFDQLKTLVRGGPCPGLPCHLCCLPCC